MKSAEVTQDDIRLSDSRFLEQVFSEMAQKSPREEALAWIKLHEEETAGEGKRTCGEKRWNKRAVFAAAAMTAVAMTIFAVDTAAVAQKLEMEAAAETLFTSQQRITAYAEEMNETAEEIHGQYLAKLAEQQALEEAQAQLQQEEESRSARVSANRDYVERVVAAEARGEPFEGMMAVAQVILDRAELWDMTPYEVVTQKNQFAPPFQGIVSEEVKQAVSLVFDDGVRIFDDPVTHFYSGSSVPYWTSGKVNRGAVGRHKFWY